MDRLPPSTRSRNPTDPPVDLLQDENELEPPPKVQVGRATSQIVQREENRQPPTDQADRQEVVVRRRLLGHRLGQRRSDPRERKGRAGLSSFRLRIAPDRDPREGNTSEESEHHVERRRRIERGQGDIARGDDLTEYNARIFQSIHSHLNEVNIVL
jgi:hypothetical protein